MGILVVDVMNTWDPDSSDSTAEETVASAAVSGVKALTARSPTAYIGYASNIAVVDGAGGFFYIYVWIWRSIKSFSGWLDDALVYIWE